MLRYHKYRENNLPLPLNLQVTKNKTVNKSDISNIVKNFDVNTKVATLATTKELKAVPDKIVQLQVFDSSSFPGNFFLVMMVFKLRLSSTNI